MGNYGEIIMYQTDDGISKINVNMYDETVWLSLDQMAELFQRDKSTISRHIKNVFEDGELIRESTVAKFATVQNEGERLVERNIEYYNLDVIAEYRKYQEITLTPVEKAYLDSIKELSHEANNLKIDCNNTKKQEPVLVDSCFAFVRNILLLIICRCKQPGR